MPRAALRPERNVARPEGALGRAAGGRVSTRGWVGLLGGQNDGVALFGRRSREESTAAGGETTRRGDGGSSFLPARRRRPGIESLFMRVVATGGIVGIGTALAAILGTQDVDAWIVGLVVSVVTVVLAAILWSSRTL